MRMYNGCPDSKLQAVFDKQDALLRKIKKHEPEAHCTYHPDGEIFQVHRWGHDLSGGFHRTRIAALEAALRRLT